MRLQATQHTTTAGQARSAIAQHLAQRRIPHGAPPLMLGARLAFAVLVQGGVAALLRGKGRPDPLHQAARWWMVDGTLVDLACLLTLDQLVDREGLTLSDLLGRERAPLGRDLLESLGALAALAPTAALSAMLQRPFYGSAALPPQVAAAKTPPLAGAYSVVAWPVLWAFAEELTYLGYTLPRLEAQTGSTRVAGALVSLAWAGQHVAMPLLRDPRYLVARPLTALPITAATTTYFLLRGRRLAPLILAHWALGAGRRNGAHRCAGGSPQLKRVSSLSRRWSNGVGSVWAECAFFVARHGALPHTGDVRATRWNRACVDETRGDRRSCGAPRSETGVRQE